MFGRSRGASAGWMHVLPATPSCCPRLEGRSTAGASGGHINLTGERGSAFKAMNKAIAALWEALGLPAVQAPGEAEAMCAALQLAGLVQACATKDSDALVLGATKVFHTITLAVRLPLCYPRPQLDG